MSKALSVDLRVRVLAAVAAGATHREAADRFGVSAASVSRWRSGNANRAIRARRRWAATGARTGSRLIMRPSWQRSDRNRDATIEEVRASLAEQGLVFGFGTIQRFFARHAITRKKRPRTPASRTAPMS